VVWTPVLFLMMFVSVQVGLVMFARHVAVTAAQEGDRVGREEAYPYYTHGSAQWKRDAQNTATSWVNNLIGGLVDERSLSAVAAGDPGGTRPQVKLTVTFSIATAFPHWDLNVTGVSQGPVECFYGAGNLEFDCEGP